MAAPGLRNSVWNFTMAASMEPKARDKWHPYRVRTVDLGGRVLEILADLKKARLIPPSGLFTMPDVVLLRSRQTR
jgi:hypothetical protein